jgi:hypothetical protein
MKTEYRSTSVGSHARFLWLAGLLLTPAVALCAYDVTPHEQIWQEVLFALLCLPLFLVFIVALIGSTLSFVMHRLLEGL